MRDLGERRALDDPGGMTGGDCDRAARGLLLAVPGLFLVAVHERQQEPQAADEDGGQDGHDDRSRGADDDIGEKRENADEPERQAHHAGDGKVVGGAHEEGLFPASEEQPMMDRWCHGQKRRERDTREGDEIERSLKPVDRLPTGVERQEGVSTPTGSRQEVPQWPGITDRARRPTGSTKDCARRG